MGALPPGRRRPDGLKISLSEPADRRWSVVRRASAVFDRPWPDPVEPTVWVVEVEEPTVVLGSTQPISVVRPGVGAVTRRSGGGAVLVEPGGLVWVDVLVPAGDPLWQVDVGRAFAWLGRAWAGALADGGLDGAEVYDGPLRTNEWSPLVCFAGLGPGEVTVEGAKVVGLCQRRTRSGALFQCAALLHWRPARLLDCLALSDEQRARATMELAGVARGLDVDAGALVDALLARLP